MFQSLLLRVSIFLAVLAVVEVPSASVAQSVLPRAGQSFTFGIIDGPYTFQDSASSLASTSLTLTVVSEYSGCGIVTSPSGYEQDFNFAPGAPTIINLPLNLIHLNDLGKTEKGLLVHTTAPVNLVLHDYIPYGGDATQILPDAALDTSYISCGWGIWDDPSDGEDDLMQFIVTASADSTTVTITPSVKTVLNQPAGVPFNVTLNRGECYIVKADTSGHPSDPSLSGSTIHATRLVSVISGLTCAYNPLEVQACNELLDELIGKKWWGTHFFTQPLDIYDNGGTLVLTGSKNFFAKINSNLFASTQGRLSTTFFGPIEVRTTDSLGNPFPVEAHQLTRSFSDCDSALGDPSLVSVLDTSQYTDTLLWNSPSYLFEHSVPIVCPTSVLNTATLDGTPLSQWATSSVINNSGFSALNPTINPGEHKIISPAPLFAISAGFYQADAYTFMAGTGGTPLPKDTVSHTILLQADSAQTCSQFNVNASINPPIDSVEGMIEFTITVTYDSTAIHLEQIVPAQVLLNATYTIDTSTPGTIVISVMGTPLITGSNLFRLIFEGWKSTTITTVGHGSTSVCADDSELITPQSVSFGVRPSIDTLQRQFLASVTKATLCQPLNLSIFTDSIVTASNNLVLEKIQVFYNPSNEQYVTLTRGNLVLNTRDSASTQPLGTFQFFLTPPTQVFGGDSVLRLQFSPLLPIPSDTFHIRVFYLECGDTIVKNITATFSIQNIGLGLRTPAAVPFDSVIACPTSDSNAVIILYDSNCVPITLDNATVNGPNWSLLGTNQKPLTLPSVLPSTSGLGLLLRFHPTVTGELNDTVKLTFTYLDSTITRNVILSGVGTPAGPLLYSRSIHYGGVSLCLPVDSILKFNNQTCDTAVIEQIKLSPPFSLVGTLPIAISPLFSNQIKIQYAPQTLSTDTGFAIITLRVDDNTVTDTLTFTGNGSPTGILQGPTTAVHFGNASPCVADSTDVPFTNKTCDTATIDNIQVSAPFTLNGSLPIVFAKGATQNLPVLYAPDSLGNDTGIAIVTVTVNDTVKYDTVKFVGQSRYSGTVQPLDTLDFGTVSVCSQAHRGLTFFNSTCDSAFVDSIHVSAPFTLAGTVPLGIPSQNGDSIQVQYAPNAQSNDSGIAIVTLTENGTIVYDTLTLRGTGIAGTATLFSNAPNNSITSSHPQCDTTDTLSFYLYNPGCDTLHFGSGGFSIVPSPNGIWSTSSNPDTVLPPGDSVKVTVVASDTAEGTYSGLFQTSYLDSVGTVHQLIVQTAETVTASARTMALDTAPFNLGSLTPCETIDTTIPYTNTSCIPVYIDAWKTLHFGSGFQVYNNPNQPTPVAPGATDSLHLTFEGAQSGTVYDTIVVTLGTDANPVRRIPVQITVPPVPVVQFTLSMPPTMAPGQSFPVDMLPDRNVTAVGLNTVSGQFAYLDNDFTFDSITAATGLTFIPSKPTPVISRNGIDIVAYTVSSASGITLDSTVPVVQLWLESNLTDSIGYAVALDSLFLNGGDPQYANCTLSVAAAGTASSQFAGGCGDSLLLEQLQGRNLLFSSAPTPNPVGADNSFIAMLNIESSANGVATIVISDALGRTVSEQNVSLTAGTPVAWPLDLNASPAGSYFYTIRFSSAYGTIARNGNVVVLR